MTTFNIVYLYSSVNHSTIQQSIIDTTKMPIIIYFIVNNTNNNINTINYNIIIKNVIFFKLQYLISND